MVHGSAQGSEVGGDRHFAAQSRLAVHGWRIVVPDRPGHGRSPAPDRPDDAELDGSWVVDLLGGGAHLVGHSFGGCVALAAAAMAPASVRSLTLIEPAMHMLAGHDPRVQAHIQKVIALHQSAPSNAQLAIEFAKLVNIPPEIRGGSSEAELDRMGAALRRLKLPGADQLRGWLQTVRQAGIPLLLVSGGWNPSFNAVVEVGAEIGGGRHAIIASDHHFPQLVSNAFNEALVAFMTAAARRT